jgi:hypothetical protein
MHQALASNMDAPIWKQVVEGGHILGVLQLEGDKSF